MADVSDENISEAYQDVRNDKTPTSWLLLDYLPDRKDTVTLTEKGEGGLSDLKERFDQSKASYGYIRLQYANDKESQREKFVFITWVGDKAGIMRKAKMSVQASDVKKVLPAFALDITTSSLDDLDEETIVKRLRKAGGASYDGV